MVGGYEQVGRATPQEDVPFARLVSAEGRHRLVPACQDATVLVHLMRHAETDWRQVNARRWRGLLNDFAPLTEAGRQQACAAADALSSRGIDLIVTSPMTRALETASTVSAALKVPMRVALDLREWLPDETWSWTTAQEVVEAYQDMVRHEGVRPEGHPFRWEPLQSVRTRAEAVLAELPSQLTVLAVCHEVVIYALTGKEATEHCSIVAYNRR